jgi:ribonuclease HI
MKEKPKTLPTSREITILCEWKRVMFKKNKVWMESDTTGAPMIKNGKVRIKYQLDQVHEYWVNPQHLFSIPGEDKVSKPETDSDDTIHVYTDGASSGNPGPAGIGVFIRYKEQKKEISKSIGIATNNIAELEAVKTGLLSLKSFNRPVRIYTDSSYAVGMLMLGWKIRKNMELITAIRKIMNRFNDIKIIHVKGHSGDEGNEQAHLLAAASAKSKFS